MEEQIEVGEVKEGLERLEGFASIGWGRYLALSTAIIAVLAAVASLVSGNFATHALLAKNDALLMQIKASDTWNEYQSKSLKIHLLRAGSPGPPEATQQQTSIATAKSRVSSRRRPDSSNHESSNRIARQRAS